MPERIGFVGLGRMGSRMVGRLLDRGYDLIVHDVRPDAVESFLERGITVADTPVDLARRAQVVLASLPTPASVEAVVLGREGLVGGFEPGSLFIDLSTTGIEVERRIAEELGRRGIEMLDAPVSGGISGAEQGTLSVMVAGPGPLVERHRPLLEVIGRNVFHVSDKPGLGQAMKLVNNLLSATALAVTSEALVLATRAGLDPKIVIDVLNVSSGRNSATLHKFPQSVLSRTFDFGFILELTCKHLHLADAMATYYDAPLLIGRTVEQVWDLARYQGLAQEDFTAIVKLFERLVGVEVAADARAPAADAELTSRGTPA